MTQVPAPVLDGILELVNIGIGRSAGSLHTLIGRHVTLHVPDVSIMRAQELKEQFSQSFPAFFMVSQEYSGAFAGTMVLMFPKESAQSLFQLLTGESELTPCNAELWKITLLEVGNILVNGVMGSITNVLEKKITFHLPVYQEGTLKPLRDFSWIADSEYVVVAHAMFSVEEENIQGEIYVLLADQAIEVLATSINEKMGTDCTKTL